MNWYRPQWRGPYAGKALVCAANACVSSCHRDIQLHKGCRGTHVRIARRWISLDPAWSIRADSLSVRASEGGGHRAQRWRDSAPCRPCIRGRLVRLEFRPAIQRVLLGRRAHVPHDCSPRSPRPDGYSESRKRRRPRVAIRTRPHCGGHSPVRDLPWERGFQNESRRPSASCDQCCAASPRRGVRRDAVRRVAASSREPVAQCPASPRRGVRSDAVSRVVA